MATFKVGQRVRMVSRDHCFIPYGAEGVLVAPGACIEWIMRYEGRLNSHNSSTVAEGWGVHPWDIEPLTDPKAEQFIENIKKLQPLNEPVSA